MSDKSISNLYNIFLFIFFSFLFYSCDNNKNNIHEDKWIGKKINFMQHAVTLHNIDTNHTSPNFDNTFKIVTYADLYCYPCWQSIMPWKIHFNDFKQYSNVTFFCYVNALSGDFDKENIKAKLNFPIFLDTQNRFRIVNKLGNNPNRLTFLLNKENEIILIGPPFSEEMKQKYIDIITGNK